MTLRPYQQCSKCIMDVTAPEIVFDENGVCNFCHEAQRELAQIACDKSLLPALIGHIKDTQKDNKYDILIGLSGGVDSSYALHKAVELGLRPLCFTMDNGWNTKQADENIMRLVETLDVPLYRYVIDIPKFKKLQAAFLQAGLKNLEAPTDHMIMAATYEVATENDIKFIVSGGNVATESIMPASWGYNARDLVQIKAVYKKFVGEELTGLPMCSLLKFNYYKWIVGLKTLYLLDYLDYNREEAIKTLQLKYGWKEYGHKHEESIYTQWFQNFYLFEKYGIDKRKAHFSSMINSGQLSRDLALESIQSNPEYPQLGIETRALQYPKHEYTDYPNDEKLYNAISKVVRFFKHGFTK